MRFISIFTHQSTDRPPTEAEMAAMGKLIAESMQAGWLIATEGVHFGTTGVRVHKSAAGKFLVTDGPFTETKEVLGGYAHFVFPYVADRLLRRGAAAPGPVAFVRELADLGAIESRSRLWFLARTPLRPTRRALGLPPSSAGHVLSREFAAGRPVGPEERQRPYRSHLNNALWHEFRREGLPEVLHADDALSMAFSLESRAPFLDHRLVELCFSLPLSDKISAGWTKSLLRRALADVVPSEILARRRKLGFSAPVGSWLSLDDNWRQARELLLDRRTLDRGIFDGRRLEHALRRFRRGPAIYRATRGDRIWRWLTLELWFRAFVDA